MRKPIWAAAVAAVLLLASCSANTGGSAPPPATKFPSEPLIYSADLTHDGKDETIIVDFSQMETQGDQMVHVSVFDGETLLWKGEACMIHADNNGIYLYRENEYTYLLTGLADAGQGIAYPHYEIFHLSAEGEVLPYRSGSGAYTLDAVMDPGPQGRTPEANILVREMNRFLEKSTLLVAATTEGIWFGTPDDPVVRTESAYEVQ